MTSRQVGVEVTLAGTDITQEISDDITRFTYGDHAGEEADDLSLTVQNRDGRWLRAWLPTEGDTIRARIVPAGWGSPLDCGDFIVDQVSFSGWPMTMSLGALAMPMNTDFSDNPKNRTWNETTLSGAAGSIAEADGLPLDYRAAYDPAIPFLSQTQKSDKAFLHELCQKYGLTMKLYSNRLVIFDMADSETEPPVLTLTPKDLVSFSCQSSIANTGYGACVVRYTNRDGETLEYTTPTTGKTGKVYRHDTTLSSLAEAQRVAQAKLREKNRGEVTFSCEKEGDTRIVSGIGVKLLGFGRFDGRYFVDNASHSIGGGFRTSLEAHGVDT